MLSTQQKTLLYYTLMGIFAIGIIWLLVAYFMFAQLTVITSDTSGSISLQESSPHSRTIDVTQNGNSITARVEAGTYTIIVKNDISASQQIVTLGIGEHKTVTVSPGLVSTITGNVTPVSTFGAKAVSASTDRLSFIDYNDPNYPLYSVNSTNTVSKLGDNRSFQTIAWANADYGVGEVITGSNNYTLSAITGTSITDLSLPFNAQSNFSYALAPNKTLYVSDGHIIYRANGDGSYTKIYTATNDIVMLNTASNQAVEFTVQPNGAPRQTGVAVLHNDGTKYQISGEIYESAWSPDGNNILLTGDNINGIFNSQLQKKFQTPGMNIISPIWLNDTTVLFVQGSDIWEYNLQAGSTTKVASIDSSIGNFSGIYLSDSHDYIYATVDRTGFSKITFGLYRVALQNQQPDTDIISSLLLILPTTDSFCTVNAITFTSTSVVMRRNTPKSNCISDIKSTIVDSKVLTQAVTDTINYQYLP